MAAHWLLVPVDLAVCALGPAAVAMRFLPWRGVERLVAGLGFSLVLIYLAGMVVRLVGLSPGWHWAVSAACLGMLVAGFGEVRRWLRDRQARAAAGVFAGVWLWTTLLGATVLNFAGERMRDAAAGVMLNVWAMSRPLAAGLGVTAPGGPVVFRTGAGESPGVFVVWNWMAKVTHGYTFVGDHLGDWRGRLLGVAVVCAAGMMVALARAVLRGPGEGDAMSQRGNDVAGGRAA